MTEPMSALSEAKRLFDEVNLPLPPIPAAQAQALREQEDWCFSTRPISPFDMYLFDKYLIQALMGQAPDYLAFSHAGHGLNSYAITYHFVEGPLALFVQAPWGGVYTDNQAASASLGRLFARSGKLISLGKELMASGALRIPGRLVICESEMRGLSAWGWIDEPLKDAESAAQWIRRSSTQAAKDAELELPTVSATAWLHKQRPNRS